MNYLFSIVGAFTTSSVHRSKETQRATRFHEAAAAVATAAAAAAVATAAARTAAAAATAAANSCAYTPKL